MTAKRAVASEIYCGRPHLQWRLLDKFVSWSFRCEPSNTSLHGQQDDRYVFMPDLAKLADAGK